MFRVEPLMLLIPYLPTIPLATIRWQVRMGAPRLAPLPSHQFIQRYAYDHDQRVTVGDE